MKTQQTFLIAKSDGVHSEKSREFTSALAWESTPPFNGTPPDKTAHVESCMRSSVVSSEQVSMFPVEPLAKELLVDTNGAGDA